MKYGLVIFPSQEVQNRVNNLRKRYDSHYSLIPPHITIKEAFEINDNKLLDATIKHIENITKNVPPFTLKINRIKSFHPTTPVLYFAFEDDQLVYKLHDDINSKELYYEKDFKFVPHLTFAQELPEQEIHDIYSRLSLKDYDLSFYVDRIHLLYQLENGVWTNHQTFLLNG